MSGDLVQIHHSDYLEDISFWKSITAGKEPVMEIGCGHGRVTIPLLEAGRIVTGIDINGQYLQFLIGRLNQGPAELEEAAEIIEADILSYKSVKRYGSVIIPCNTYSTFLPPERLELLFKIHNWLKPDGLFTASLPNPVNLKLLQEQLDEAGEADQEIETTLEHPETGHPIQVSSRFHTTGNTLGWDWIYDHLMPDGTVERVVHTAIHDLASFDRYQEELHEAGFVVINTLGEFEGGKYGPDSPYLILICRR